MTLTIEKQSEAFVLGLSGKVDAEDSNVLLERITGILEGGGRHVLLDFTGATYINSSGLHALVIAGKKLAIAGGQLILAAPSDPILKVLKISGISSVLPVYSTQAQALSSFQR